MKLLYLNSLRNYGGGEKHTWFLMQGLRQRGWRVHLATPSRSPLGEQALAGGFSVHRMPFRSKWDAGSAASLYRLMRRERFDVVHAQDQRSFLLSMPMAWLAGVPARVVTVHMVNTERSYPPKAGASRTLYRAIDRWLSRLVTGIIAVSSWNRDALQREGIPLHKVRIIYPGIDLGEFGRPEPLDAASPLAAVPEDAPVVGVVGRLEPQKGLDVLLRAAPAVLERHPQAYLVLVGDGPQRPRLEGLALELGVRERVIFAGFRKDVSALVRQFTVLAVPSLYEGLPVAPMEAYMAGVPVVATAVYGVPEVVMDGVTGLLVPPGEPAPLADALVSLLEDAPRRARMAEAGKRLVQERFPLEAMVEATEAYYRELLSAKRLPARAAPAEARRVGE